MKELVFTIMLGILGALFILAMNAIGIVLVFLTGRGIVNYLGL